MAAGNKGQNSMAQKALLALIGVGAAAGVIGLLLNNLALKQDTAAAAAPPPGASAPEGETGIPQEGLSEGTKAPEFAFQTLKGNKTSLEGLRGQVVLLDFWATWCGPCRMSIPVVEGLHKKYASQGLTVIGISAEQGEKIGPFAQQSGMTYTLAADPDGAGAAGASYRVNTIPALAVIDRKGTIRRFEIGFDPTPGAGTKERLDALVSKLLAEKG